MLKVLLIGALVLASSVSAGAQWTADGRPVAASDASKMASPRTSFLFLDPSRYLRTSALRLPSRFHRWLSSTVSQMARNLARWC